MSHDAQGSPQAGLKFERLAPRHAGALGAFFEALSRAGDERNFHPHPLDAAEARRRAEYRGLDEYYVAVLDGRIVAYGMLRGWDEGYDVPSLGIAVAAECRGRGLAAALMAFLHAAARLRGAPKVRLTVLADNAAALNLYRRLGYEFGETRGDSLVGFLTLERSDTTPSDA